jgi:hypothetical protein
MITHSLTEVEPDSTKNKRAQYKKTFEEFYKHSHFKGSLSIFVCSTLIFLINTSEIVTHILVGWMFSPIISHYDLHNSFSSIFRLSSAVMVSINDGTDLT